MRWGRRKTTSDSAGAIVADAELSSLVDEIDALVDRHQEGRISRAELDHLVVLRHRAGRRVVQVGPGPLPGPPAIDVFAGTTGLPEVAAEHLTGDHVASALRFHGSLLVRGLVGAADLERIGADIDAGANPEPFPLHPTDDAGEQVAGSTPMACSTPRLQDLLGAYGRAGLLEALTDYFGGRPLLASERSQILRRGKGPGLPWHQDGAFFGGSFGAVDVWLAMTPCGTGTDAPGLSVVARRFDGVIGSEEGEKQRLLYDNDLDDDRVAELAGDHEIVSPTLAAGDAVLFDELTVHRTQRTPWNVPHKDRAIMWFFPAERFPTDFSPLMV